MGGLQEKSMTSQRNRAAHKMADMRYYGNVMDNNKMAAICYYGNYKKKDYKVDKQVQSTTVLLKM